MSGETCGAAHDMLVRAVENLTDKVDIQGQTAAAMAEQIRGMPIEMENAILRAFKKSGQCYAAPQSVQAQQPAPPQPVQASNQPASPVSYTLLIKEWGTAIGVIVLVLIQAWQTVAAALPTVKP